MTKIENTDTQDGLEPLKVEDLYTQISRRWRSEMRAMDVEDRTEPPLDMSVGFSRDLTNMDMCYTRVFVMPGHSCIELGRGTYVPFSNWRETAVKEAWDWYDYWGTRLQ